MNNQFNLFYCGIKYGGVNSIFYFHYVGTARDNFDKPTDDLLYYTSDNKFTLCDKTLDDLVIKK